MVHQGVFVLLIAVACLSTTGTASQDEGLSCGKADILFILDSTFNVGSNYMFELDFVSDLTSRFTLGPDAVQFAALVFSYHFDNVFGFSKYHESSSLQAAIRSLPFYNSGTFSAAVLQSARIYSFTSANGARPNVAKIAVVITDAKSLNGTELAMEAYLLKMSGVTVYSIEIGTDTNQAKLDSIASSPSHTFIVPTFNSLDSIKDEIEEAICQQIKKDPKTECISTSCLGKVDGNYTACDPECRQGYYYSCVNEFAYRMQCELGSYVDDSGNQFLAKMVYNPAKGLCEPESESCPRIASDYLEVQRRSRIPVPELPDPPACLSSSDTCYGRPDGNYPKCYPDCQGGFYYKCQDGEAYEIPCQQEWYVGSNKNLYLARRVYDAVSDSCQVSAGYCPRNPQTAISSGPGSVGQSGKAEDVVTQTCEGKADILLIIDSSGSIGELNFEIEKQFVADITSKFRVGPDAFQFAAMAFSNNVLNLFGFSKYTTHSEVRQGILDASFLGGGTNTASALTFARTYFFSVFDGARAGVPKYAVVVTDGISQDPVKTAEEAQKLKDSGVAVIVVGVGSQVRKSELKTIASSSSYVFKINDFNALGHLRKALVSKLCEKKRYLYSCAEDTCRGKPDGNYAYCHPKCMSGYYYSCVNEFAYQMPCAMGWYTDENGNTYLARMIYDPVLDRCELESDYCPRYPVIIETTPHLPATHAQTTTLPPVTQPEATTERTIPPTPPDPTLADTTVLRPVPTPYPITQPDSPVTHDNHGYETTTVPVKTTVPLSSTSAPDTTTRAPTTTTRAPTTTTRAPTTTTLAPTTTTTHAPTTTTRAPTTTTLAPTTTIRTPTTTTSAPLPSPCMNKYDSCSGRADGNYAMCYPDCQSGDYYSCSNDEKYTMPCPLSWYEDEDNNPFLAKMVYDPSTDTCELTADYCPGGSEGEGGNGDGDGTDNEEECPALVDVIFALDSSGSISRANYSLQLDFVVNLARRFQIGPNDARFGAVLFSYYAEKLFDLNTFDNHESLALAVRSAPYYGSSTHTHRALNKINYDKMFSSDKGGRDNARDVVIVITDGKTTRPVYTYNAAESLKDQKVEIMAVGIADADESELEWLVSRPNYVFKAADFTALSGIEAELTKRTCEVAPTCRGQADILFVLDSSGSIGPANFETLKTFVASLTESFTVGPHDIQFGAISYSSKVHTLFNFNTFQTNSAVWQELLNSPYISGGTNTAEALSDAQKLFTTSPYGARANAGKVAVVVTDGYSNDAIKTATQADLLKNQGVTVIAIGVGVFGPNELNAIASSPSHVFSVNSFDVLEVIRSGVVTTTCQSQQRQNTCVSLSCKGKPNGNYSACNPECKEGHFYTCINENKFKQHCDFGQYLHPYSNSSYYTARQVFDPITNTCKPAVGSCPRNPINYIS